MMPSWVGTGPGTGRMEPGAGWVELRVCAAVGGSGGATRLY